MRVHFSFIVTTFVALLLVSGTTGCRSNGGAWYKPTSYTFSNPIKIPFSKDKESAPLYADSQNTKPSLGEIPSVNTPPSGYTTDGSLAAGRTGSAGGTVSTNPPEHWPQHNNPMAPNSSGTGGYSGPIAAYPSDYLPYTEPYNGQGASPAPSYQYPQGVAQHQHTMPYHTQIPSGYEMTNAVQPNVYPTSPGVADNGGGNYITGTSSPYQYEQPYVANHQQPAGVQTAGFGYDPATHAPHQTQPPAPYQGYPGDGISVGVPPQPYQPPAAGSGYNYNTGF